MMVQQKAIDDRNTEKYSNTHNSVWCRLSDNIEVAPLRTSRKAAAESRRNGSLDDENSSITYSL
jgi:hypothetical protein